MLPVNVELVKLQLFPSTYIAPPSKVATFSAKLALLILVLFPTMYTALPSTAEFSLKVALFILVLFPLIKIAPPLASSLFETEFEVKLELLMETLLPVRQIAPPLELEVPLLIPLLLVNSVLLTIPLFPSQ